jgi:NAD(P)-dependent dehydrogenase (short-subunit alcohol dehydrogenase family)
MQLEGKIALVTGGSAGIGLAAAQALAAEGAHVYITGRRQEELDRARDKIGARSTAIRADAGKPTDLDTLFEAVRGRSGSLDIVVANAGMYEMEMLADVTEASVDKMFDVNVKGVLFTVQKALPLLNDGAAIVLIGSMGGSKGFAGFSVYNATKAAVRSFARSWAAELKDRKIRVNVVSPGPVDTPGFQAFANDEMRIALASMIPLGRVATPEEIGKAVRFLATGESSFVNGIELHVDGGVTQL